MLLLLPGNADQYLPEVCKLLDCAPAPLQSARTIAGSNSATHFTNDIVHVPDPHSNSDSSDQINALLGTENLCVIFDAHGSFNERLFAAAAGTIVAGGTLVLLTPTLELWPRSANQGHPSEFIARLVRKIKLHQTAELFEQATQNEFSQEKACLIAGIAHTANKPESPTTPHWQAEQDAQVNEIVSNLLADSSSTIVVQADRGRGKSALIGRALKEVIPNLTDSGKTITITATRRRACDVLLQHAWDGEKEQNPIRFMPIDEALKNQHDLLLIEEAGSISLPVLTTLTNLSMNIVFATTVAGYEGAGRGFALRFSKQLETQRPGWVLLQPTHPIRWADNDPVEKFVNDALLLATTLLPVDQHSKPNPSHAQLVQLTKQELSSNDVLLKDIYSLLIQAHYQTTPADLRHLLDQEKLLVFAQHTNGLLTGAALVAVEGEIPTELHGAILNKSRRVPDQILPQLFAQSAATSCVLSHRYARIVRIAVHPSLQRRGFGTALFYQLQEQLQPTVDTFGASFGADEQSLSFWLKLGLSPIHYGYKANPRSGLCAACVVTSTNSLAMQAIDKAMYILHENLRVLADHSNVIDHVREQLIKAAGDTSFELSSFDINKLVSNFSNGERSFIDTVGFIQLNETVQLSDAIKSDFLALVQRHEQLTPKHRRTAEQRVREFLLDQLPN